MSTTRIVNGVEYTIPPGTEHIWTAPEEVVISAPSGEVTAADAINGLRVQALVRLQDETRINALSDQLATIWQNFLDKAITKDELTAQVGNFRNTELENAEGVDNITVQFFETVILKMLSESNL
jgi:hypothetical protein